MRAAVLHSPKAVTEKPLVLEDVPRPQPDAGEVLLRVEACGVCRTDLHITAGELPTIQSPLIPGHQIVGEVVANGPGAAHETGTRVGVSWMGGVDGTCAMCRMGRENLCDHPVFTGYSRNGGYAEFVTARADVCYPLPGLSAEQAAPLLCAGVIGFRTLRVAEIKPGDRVGLFGFGASAHLCLPVLRHWGCEVYVSTRGEGHRALAQKLGATWVGDAVERPPVKLDSACTFAPSGDVVIAALASLRKGGIVAINAIHLDRIPQFDYDSLFWGERQMRSVANMTRQDARDFLALAAEINLRPQIRVFPLEQANEALAAIAEDEVNGAAVLRMS